jgi:hypothetical protein
VEPFTLTGFARETTLGELLEVFPHEVARQAKTKMADRRAAHWRVLSP